MELTGQAKLLRVFIGEADKIAHKALYEVIVEAARQAKLADAMELCAQVSALT